MGSLWTVCKYSCTVRVQYVDTLTLSFFARNSSIYIYAVYEQYVIIIRIVW